MGERAYLTVYVPLEEMRSPDKEYYQAFLEYKKGNLSYSEVKALADKTYGSNGTYQDYQGYAFTDDDRLPRCTILKVNEKTYIQPDEFVCSYGYVQFEKKVYVPVEWLRLFDGTLPISSFKYQRELKEILALGLKDYKICLQGEEAKKFLECLAEQGHEEGGALLEAWVNNNLEQLCLELSVGKEIAFK